VFYCVVCWNSASNSEAGGPGERGPDEECIGGGLPEVHVVGRSHENDHRTRRRCSGWDSYTYMEKVE